MSQKLTCPHCEAVFKTKQTIAAGKKVRCPKCAEPFTVPDEEDEGETADDAVEAAPRGKARRKRDDDEDEPAPAKKKRPKDDDENDDDDRPRSKKAKDKGSGLVLGLAIGGGLLALLLLCGGGAGIWFMTRDKTPVGPGPIVDKGPGPIGDKGPGPVAKSKLNLDTWQKFDTFMKKEEVAALFGPDKAATDADVIAGLQAAKYDQQIGAGQVDVARKSGTRSWLSYQDGDDSLFVGYAPTTKGDRVVYGLWISPKENDGHGAYRSKKFFAFTPDPLAEIEKETLRRDKEGSVINDPKWKTGNEARAALMGAWQHATGSKGYDFQNDGKVKETTLLSPKTYPYEFTDPQQLKIGKSTYRVLVSQDEMYLVQDTRILIGPFRRKK